MINYIVYDVLTGVIITTATVNDTDFSNIVLNDNQAILRGIADINNDYIINGQVMHLTTNQMFAKNNLKFGYRWDSSSRAVVKVLPDSEITNYNKIVVRRQRDILLTECDWTQTLDQPENRRLLYQPYRQQLRDITIQESFPFDVMWPVKPE